MLKTIFKKLLPIILLAVLALGLVYGAYYDTPTYDEPANMAASFDYVYRNDFRIYPDNPPLVKILAGLALYPLKNKLDFPSNLEIYHNAQEFDLYAFGREFVFQKGNFARQIQFLSRLPNIVITISLGIIIYLFAKDLFDYNSALLALFFYSFDPNIRGHGHILAFDIPLAIIITTILYLTYKLIKTNVKKKAIFTLRPLALTLIILFSLGFLVKFTFVFFGFIYIIGILLVGKRRKIQLKHLFTFIFTMLASSFLVLWLFGLLTNYNKQTLDYNKLPIIASANTKLAKDIKWNLMKALPVPYYYKKGMQTMYTHSIVSQPAYLLGQVRARNDWFFYFPASFLLKVPLPTQLIIYLSIFFIIQKLARRKKLIFREYGFFAVGAYFMLCMMIFSHINNVYRYLFTTFAMFVIGASQMVKSKVKSQKSKLHVKSQRGKDLKDFNLQQIILLFIVCYLLLTSILSFPYDLSYTNEFTGIPPKGYKYLSDSEIDWGQDLERLSNWLKKNNYDREVITLSYLGTSDPAYYGIKYKPLKFQDLQQPLKVSPLKGIVVISVGNLTLGDWQWRSKPEYKIGLLKAPLDMLRVRKPDVIIGKSIFIYKVK